MNQKLVLTQIENMIYHIRGQKVMLDLDLENQMNDRFGKLEENTSKLFKIIFERLDTIEEDLTPHLPKHRSKIGLKGRE